MRSYFPASFTFSFLTESEKEIYRNLPKYQKISRGLNPYCRHASLCCKLSFKKNLQLFLCNRVLAFWKNCCNVKIVYLSYCYKSSNSVRLLAFHSRKNQLLVLLQSKMSVALPRAVFSADEPNSLVGQERLGML